MKKPKGWSAIYEPPPGANIWESCQTAARIAKKNDAYFTFRHNGKEVHASPGDTPDVLYEQWRKQWPSQP